MSRPPSALGAESSGSRCHQFDDVFHPSTPRPRSRSNLRRCVGLCAQSRQSKSSAVVPTSARNVISQLRPVHRPHALPVSGNDRLLERLATAQSADPLANVLIHSPAKLLDADLVPPEGRKGLRPHSVKPVGIIRLSFRSSPRNRTNSRQGVGGFPRNPPLEDREMPIWPRYSTGPCPNAATTGRRQSLDCR